MVATDTQTLSAHPTSYYMSVLEDVITTIGQGADRKKILGTILPCALEISGMEVGALLVAADTPNNMNAVVRRGLPNEMVAQLTRGDLGRLLLMGQRLWIKPRPTQNKSNEALLGRHKLKYLLGIPFRFEGQVLGAIVVGTRRMDFQELSDEQQRHLTILAQITALFLDDVRLRTQTANGSVEIAATELAEPAAPVGSEMEQLLAAIMSAEEEVVSQNSDLGLLNQIFAEMGGTLQLNQILEATVQQTVTALRGKASWCYLYEHGNLVLRGHCNLSEAYVSQMNTLSPGSGVEGMAFSRNETIVRDGALFHAGRARDAVKAEGLKVVAAVPLRSDDTPFGVLAVTHTGEHEVTSRDRRMLESIGKQVERAILNSQKFTEIEQKANTWKNNYKSLEESNARLTERMKLLEYQVQTLRQIERQIWSTLAGSIGNKSSKRRGQQQSDPQTDEALAIALKRILTSLRNQMNEVQQTTS